MNTNHVCIFNYFLQLIIPQSETTRLPAFPTAVPENPTATTRHATPSVGKGSTTAALTDLLTECKWLHTN